MAIWSKAKVIAAIQELLSEDERDLIKKHRNERERITAIISSKFQEILQTSITKND